MKQVYEVICRRIPTGRDFVADEKGPFVERELGHTPDEVEEIRGIMHDHVRAARVASGEATQTLDEAAEKIRTQAMSAIRRAVVRDSSGKGVRFSGFVRDGFWNPRSGAGSSDDPGMYNFAYTPVSMSPQQATALYSSGGIPAVITDKKAKGCLLNGYGFEGSGWSEGEKKTLREYADKVGFGPAVADSLRDGLVYGGAVCYPRLKQDNVASLAMTFDDLLARGFLKKDSISHFVSADRWNCVIVPNWNVTARDYLTPSHYYIPIGGVKVSTRRSAVVRPKMLPYWGMLPQIGWGISDFEGYASSVLAYQIVVMSVPIMAQQLSILFHEVPFDAQLAMAGLDDVMATMAQNQQVLDAASMFHTVSVNSIGQVKAIERHFEGFGDLVGVLQVDICARGEMPQTVVFPSAPTGLADSRGEDVLLKQAESVQKISISVAPQYRQVVKIIAISCFGPDYFDSDEGRRKLGSLSMTFNPPSVQTAKEKAESAEKYSEFISKMTSADFPVDSAVEMAKQFFPDVEVPESVMRRIRSISEGDVPPEYVDALREGGLAEKLAGAVGPSAQMEKVLTAEIAEKLPELVGANGKERN